MRFLVGLLAILIVTAQVDASVWFARAQASGDGTGPAEPIGSSVVLDAATRPGDIIILLPGKQPFDGGIALKKNQTLDRPIPTRTGSHAAYEVPFDQNALVMALCLPTIARC